MTKYCLNEKGYIIPAMFIIFGFLLAILLLPKHFPKPDGNTVSTGGCLVGDDPTTQTYTLPIIKDKLGATTKGGPDTSTTTTYHMIRANVITQVAPIFRNPNLSTPQEHTILYSGANVPQRAVYYPGEAGEITLAKNGQDVFFRPEGMILFVHTDASGNNIESQGKDGAGHDVDTYTVDFYQDDEDFSRVKGGQTQYTYADVFGCTNPLNRAGGGGGGVLLPEQSPSTDQKQLQLQWFLFGSGGGSKVMAAHCKPAVYLYPPEEERINVKVTPAGFLTYTDPLYDSDLGWNVTAYPTGQLINKDAKSYSYLYFESKIRDEVIKKPTLGWVVKYSDLPMLYQQILPKLGLNPTQTKDFSTYWEKALKNDSPYYFVGVIDQSNVNQIERLDITPKPDYINRVRIYFERLDQHKQVEAPVLNIPSLDPTKFNVVEWGGMVKNDLTHPFTCSQ